MAIPPQQVEEIRDRNNIVEVISEYLNLKRDGANYKALCPFHSEKTPSFKVSPSKQIFHCFGCGKGGNVFTFVQEIENISFYEALKKLAARVGIILKEDNKKVNSELPSLRKRIFEINQKVAELYNQNLLSLPKSAPARKYLAARNITDDVIKKYLIGFSNFGYDKLFNKLKNLGFKTDDLSKSQVFYITKSSQYIDRFNNRITFPIYNIYSKISGFGGRLLKDEKDKAKYINSPDSPVFNKSRSLYGIQFSKNEIRKHDRVFIVEGYFDVISLQEKGILNVIASSGTSLTNDQVHFLKRFTKFATLIYDSDSAGIKAAIRGAKIFEDNELHVNIINLPASEDPDSYIRKHSKEEFFEYIKNAKDLFEFQLDEIFTNCNTKDQRKKMRAFSESIKVLSDIRNPIILKHNIKKVSNFFALTEKSIRKNLKAEKTGASITHELDEPVLVIKKKDILEITSEELIKSLIECPNKIAYVEDRIKPDFIKNKLLKDIFINLCTYNKKNKSFSLASFLDFLENPELEKLVREIDLIAFKLDKSKMDTAICDYITLLQKQSIKAELKQLEKEIKIYKANDDPRLQSAMRKFIQLKKSEKNQHIKNIKDMHEVTNIKDSYHKNLT